MFCRILPTTAFFNRSLLAAAMLTLASCHPTAGPDKTLTGGVLGAGWGAGAGAVIGNQMNQTGPGALIGSGLGAAAGLVTGVGLDISEGTELEQQREIDALKVQVAANRRNLFALQDNLDSRGKMITPAESSLAIFFDSDRASIRTGSAAELQRFSERVKLDPYVRAIEIHGHSDDTGNKDRNQKLSEARARTIQSFLVQNGVSMDRIRIVSHGAAQPLASNENDSGKQLNRRAEIVVLK